MKDTKTFIQVVINTTLLREIDERKLINAYARYCVNNDEDLTDRNKIRQHLVDLLDWDINGDFGLGIYCGKFEKISRPYWEKLIDFIIKNKSEIDKISYFKKYELQRKKIRLSQEQKNRLVSENTFLQIGHKNTHKGKPCEYNGVIYNSRREAMIKNNLTKNQLYKYLISSGQHEKNIS